MLPSGSTAPGLDTLLPLFGIALSLGSTVLSLLL